MEPEDNIDQVRTPSWGSPAARSTPKIVQNKTSQQNPFSNDKSDQQGQSPGSQRFQRHSPYHSDNRGRGYNNSGNIFQNNRKQNDNSIVQNQGQNFSPRNPFSNKGQNFSPRNPFNNGQNFSSDNPFQNRTQNFSPSNPFHNRNQQSNSANNLQMQPGFHSSPLTRTPGMVNHSFSPRTPNNHFQTPSPRGYGYNNNSNSSKRYGQRNSNMGNPGGSTNILDYVHPSMLEDPWKDLPPKPVLKSY